MATRSTDSSTKLSKQTNTKLNNKNDKINAGKLKAYLTLPSTNRPTRKKYTKQNPTVFWKSYLP